MLLYVFICCQLWLCYYARPDSVVGPTSSIVSTTFSTTKYVVHVGSTIDGIANVAGCSSSSPTALSSCNLRSAWALCQSLITTVTCPSSGSPSTISVTCTIVLSGMSKIQLLKAYGSNGLDVTGLSTWATSCLYTQVSLSIASSTSSQPAIIAGDSSSAPLLILPGIPFMDFTMENVTLTGFGDGSSSSPGVVVLTSIRSARFAHMQIGPQNVIFAGSAISLGSVSSTSIIDCTFVGNKLTFAFSVTNPSLAAIGGGLSLTDMNNVLISGCSFVGNLAVFANNGAAIGILRSNNVAIISSSFANNTVSGGFGWGGAVFMTYATNISIVSSRFDGNSAEDGDGAGGAVYVSFSSFINIIDTLFTNNSALDGGGKGGALGIYHSTNTLVKKCTFIGNSAQEGGGIAIGRSTIVDIIEIYAMNNAAAQEKTSSLIRVSEGNGGFLTVQTNNLYISVVKSTFLGNTAATNGGAFFFGNNNSYVAITNSTFRKNVAMTGSGGAVYMGSSNQFISFGGAMPSFHQQNFEDSTGITVNVQGSILTRGGMRVMGYYAVFDTSIFGTCNDYIQVGNYLAGAASNCSPQTGWDASHMPGMNGKAPYYINQTDIIGGQIKRASGWMDLILAPVVTATNLLGNDIVPTLSFIGNQAGSGGGAMYLFAQHRYVFFMRGTSFTNNAVTSSNGEGGAIYMGTQNQNIFVFSNTFQGGQGGRSGGAVAIFSNNILINFYDCVFVSNTAHRGGAIFVNLNNGDTAATDGNGVQFIGGSIVNNIASFGGGIYTIWVNVILVQQMQVSGNVALDRGGAIFVNMGFQSLVLETVTFSNNRAGISGGAIASDVDDLGTPNAMNLLTLRGEIVFQGNNAGSLTERSKGFGGAMAVTTSSLILKTDTQMILRNNTADGGSAIMLVSTVESAVSITTAGPGVRILLADNVCRSIGGTVYWLRNSNATIESALGPLLQQNDNYTNGNTVVWTNNNAPLSKKMATQPTIMYSLMSSTTIELVKYDSFIRPSPSFQLVDSFGVVNSTDFASTASAIVTSHNCGKGRIGYLSGVQDVQFSAGVATFDSLSAFCFPGGNMTVQFTAQLSGVESYHSLRATMNIHFRTCHDGEVLKDNVCQQCPFGSYSFAFNPANQCTPCPPNTNDCSGATINVSPGYWRPNAYSKVFLKCPYPTGCIGGIIASGNSSSSATTVQKMRHLTSLDGKNDECALGYEGPLCGVCSKEYYLNLGSKECQTCQGNGPSEIAKLVLVPLFLLAFLWLITSTKYSKYNVLCLPMLAAATSTSTTRPTRTPTESNEDVEEPTNMTSRLERMLERMFSTATFDTITPKFKIVITSFQILSTFPDSFGYSTLSGSSSSVLRSLSYFVNLLAVPGSPRCYTSRYDYVDRLMLNTISPIVICAILPLMFRFHYAYSKRRDDSLINLIVSQYVSMFLVITYTVLPSVCTSIFGIFSPCVNVDPEGLSSTTYSLYLPKDMSISCNSSRYYFGISWASVMIIIYPFGIPCLYLYLLFLSRAEIILQKERQIQSNKRKSLKVYSRNSVIHRDPLSRSINGSEVIHRDALNRGTSSSEVIHRDALNRSINDTHSFSSSINGIHLSHGNGGDSLDNSTNGGGPLSNKVNGRGSLRSSRDDGNGSRLTLEPASVSSPGALLFSPREGDHLLGTVILVANNHAAKILSDESMLKYVVNELEFLHRDYRANYWYWEIVLTYGKLLMTAVVSIIYPGSNDQIVIAWNIAFILMLVQNKASPYLDIYDDNLKAIADFQILIFLIIALIRHNDLLSGIIWRIYFEIIIMIIIFSSPIAALWYTFIAPSETVANLRREYREAKAKAAVETQAHKLEDAMSLRNVSTRGHRSPSLRQSQRIDGNRQPGHSFVSEGIIDDPVENSGICAEIQVSSTANSGPDVENSECRIRDDGMQLCEDNAELSAKAAVELSRKSNSSRSNDSHQALLQTTQRQITLLPSMLSPFSSTQKVHVDGMGANDEQHYNDNNKSNKNAIASNTTLLLNGQMGSDRKGHNLENSGMLPNSYCEGNVVFDETLPNAVDLSHSLSALISRVSSSENLLKSPNGHDDPGSYTKRN